MFAVSYADWPASAATGISPLEWVESTRQFAIFQHGPTAHDEPYGFQGRPGRDMEFEDSNRSFYARTRFFVSGSRFYQLTVVGPPRSHNPGRVAQFLDSISLAQP